MKKDTRNYPKSDKFDPWPGYWKGGPIQPPDAKKFTNIPLAADPEDIEDELEKNRKKSIVQEPDTNYEARPGTDDEPDKEESEDA